MDHDYSEYQDDSDKPDRDHYDRKRPAVRTVLLNRKSEARLVDVQDKVTGEWRQKIRMVRIKFDDEKKAMFLDEFRKWGRMGEAAGVASVSPQCVRKAMEDDEEFAQAVLIAEEAYKDKLIRHHQSLVFNGTVKETYDRNGGVVSRETIYPQRLIELELKANDERYRDKVETKVTIQRGVMVAPAEVESVDDWEKRFAKAIDVTPVKDDVDDADPPF